MTPEQKLAVEHLACFTQMGIELLREMSEIKGGDDGPTMKLAEHWLEYRTQFLVLNTRAMKAIPSLAGPRGKALWADLQKHLYADT